MVSKTAFELWEPVGEYRYPRVGNQKDENDGEGANAAGDGNARAVGKDSGAIGAQVGESMGAGIGDGWGTSGVDGKVGFGSGGGVGNGVDDVVGLLVGVWAGPHAQF